MERTAPVAWQQDFEGIPPGIGHLPPGWVDGGGNHEFGVVDTIACQGTRSLYLHGVLGGNWSACVGAPIVPSLTYVDDFILELWVRNGSEPLSGVHPNRAIVNMRTYPSPSSPGRLFFQVYKDGRLDGPVGPMGPYLQLDACYRMRVHYTRLDAQTVRLQYWLDDSPLADLTLPAFAYENNLVWFYWVCDEGSAWFDDIVLSSVVFPDCNSNGIPDASDISAGTSTDCNANGVPDECEILPDCNTNGIPDECDIVLSHNCCATGHGAMQ